jgi:hypothetical protein
VSSYYQLVWIIDAGELFNGDQATFVDIEMAKTKLTPLAERLNHGDTVELLGAMAHPQDSFLGDDPNPGGLQLCEARAEAVKSLLVQMGVAESQITSTGGLGYFADHAEIPGGGISEWDENGVFQESVAAQNRTIVATITSTSKPE